MTAFPVVLLQRPAVGLSITNSNYTVNTYSDNKLLAVMDTLIFIGIYFFMQAVTGVLFEENVSA